MLHEDGDFCFLGVIALFAERFRVEYGRVMTLAVVRERLSGVCEGVLDRGCVAKRSAVLRIGPGVRFRGRNGAD